MNCCIIRDLLPSYIDGLTTEESNLLIEKHLQNCSECQEIYQQMKTSLQEKAIIYDKEKIKPFKKLNKKVWQAIIATFIGCCILVVSYIYFFAIGWAIDAQDMMIDYSYQNGELIFDFELTNGRVLNAWTMADNLGHQIELKQCFPSILDDRLEYPNQFSFRINCLDEKGQMKTFDEDDKLIIVFSDQTKTYVFKNILQDLAIKQ